MNTPSIIHWTPATEDLTHLHGKRVLIGLLHEGAVLEIEAGIVTGATPSYIEVDRVGFARCNFVVAPASCKLGLPEGTIVRELLTDAAEVLLGLSLSERVADLPVQPRVAELARKLRECSVKPPELTEEQRLVLGELGHPQAGGFTGAEMAKVTGMATSQAGECMSSLVDLGFAGCIKLDGVPAVWYAKRCELPKGPS